MIWKMHAKGKSKIPGFKQDAAFSMLHKLGGHGRIENSPRREGKSHRCVDQRRKCQTRFFCIFQMINAMNRQTGR